MSSNNISVSLTPFGTSITLEVVPQFTVAFFGHFLLSFFSQFRSGQFLLLSSSSLEFSYAASNM